MAKRLLIGRYLLLLVFVYGLIVPTSIHASFLKKVGKFVENIVKGDDDDDEQASSMDKHSAKQTKLHSYQIHLKITIIRGGVDRQFDTYNYTGQHANSAEAIAAAEEEAKVLYKVGVEDRFEAEVIYQASSSH